MDINYCNSGKNYGKNHLFQNNRWRKRGLSLMPMCFNIGYGGFRFGVMVNTYTHDGTVAISHGGIEMGQGLNTKVGHND